jgi:hypothetical protein
VSQHLLESCVFDFVLTLCYSLPAKRNITNEREALKDALDKYEIEGLQSGKLLYSSMHTSPDLGDIAVFGVLYSVRGLNAHHNAIQLRGGAVKEWYDRMSMQVLGVRSE